MLNNYFNPDSAKPQIGSPLLQGFYMPEQMNQYRQMMNLQQQMGAADVDLSQMKNEEYRRDAGVREAARPAAISKSGLETMSNTERMTNPNFVPSQVRGEIGESQTKEAKGRYDQATADSRAHVTNVENMTKQWEAAAHQLSVTASNNPMMTDAEYRKLLSTLPEAVRGHFPQFYTPQVPQMLQSLSKALVNSPEHQRKIQEIQATGQYHKDVAAGNNAATIEAAKLRAGARIKSLTERFQAARTPQEVIMMGEMLLADPELDDDTRKQIQVGVDRAYRIQSTNTAKGQFNFNDPRAGSGPIADEIERRLRGPAGMGGGTGITPQPGTAQNPIRIR